MKPVAYFSALIAAAAMAAGCTGTSNVPAVPSAPSGPGNLSGATRIATPMTVSAGRHLVVPLTFDGRSFTIGKFASCSTVKLADAKPFSPKANRLFRLSAKAALKPTCLRSQTRRTHLYIAGLKVGTRRPFLVPIGGAAKWGAATWKFAPIKTGIALRSRAKYVFFVVAVDDSTQSYQPAVALNFDGTNFTVPPYTECGAPGTPYAAPTSGPLALSGTVTVTPTCAPTAEAGDDCGGQNGQAMHRADYYTCPTPGPLYIVAAASDDENEDDAVHSSIVRMHPADDNQGDQNEDSVLGTPIAGPVNATDNPWNFVPLTTQLLMTGGVSYDFYVAQQVNEDDQGDNNQGDQ